MHVGRAAIRERGGFDVVTASGKRNVLTATLTTVAAQRQVFE